MTSNNEQANNIKELALGVNKVLEELGWKWKPKWLDPLLFQNELYWFKTSDKSVRFKGWIFILTKDIEEAALHLPQRDCIPILPWEEIEGVLEKAGYIVRVRDNEGFGEDCKYNCGIYGDKLGIGASAKSRQEAVMKAIVELGKELEIRDELCYMNRRNK